MIFDVEDLIEKGLVRKKTYDNGLSVLKYHNKVFYNNLWNTDKRLLDCRGTVIDQNNEIVSMPFTKVFNLYENGTTIDRDLKVVAARKVNGFMAAATMHKGNLLVSTTGTLDSDYAKLALEHIGDKELRHDHTYLFEICDKNDPHIVDEQEGAYLIGCRANYIGSRLFKEDELDFLAKKYSFKRPEHFECLFSELMKKVKECRHEGFMVRDAKTGETLCKIKSPYYLAKKFFMRMSAKKIELIFGSNIDNLKKIIDEEYYPLFDYIKTFDKDEWICFNDQQRRKLIEEFLECQY